MIDNETEHRSDMVGTEGSDVMHSWKGSLPSRDQRAHGLAEVSRMQEGILAALTMMRWGDRVLLVRSRLMGLIRAS